ncbi:MAG: metallophosphoesterase [Bacteroidetes bacterium]|nr:metallophosphoesterase [Bacteroidota bacterium]
MKTGFFIIFISIILLVHGLVNYYIYARGVQAFQLFPKSKLFFQIGFIVLALSYIIGRVLERAAPGIFSQIFVYIGSYWFAAMLYFFLLIVLVDLIRVFNYFVPFYPGFIANSILKTKAIVGFLSIAIVAIIITIGYFNAKNTKIKTINLKFAKHSEQFKNLNIVVASDIHLGTIIGKSRLLNLVNKINDLKPDIVLFAGDVVDEDIRPVIDQDLGQLLLRIESKYGVFAITGNHEYIGGAEEACKYLSAHNVQMIRDTVIKVGDIFIAGREDKDIVRHTGKQRKTVKELLQGIDKTKPIILLDHQPFDMMSAVTENVDLQLSGHTHSGQLFPFNFVTGKMFEEDWGFLKKGNTNFYVSCGFGTWGPPIRIGSHSEIVNFKIEFL